MKAKTFASLIAIAIVSICACGKISGQPIEGVGSSPIKDGSGTESDGPATEPYVCTFAPDSTHNMGKDDEVPILGMECATDNAACSTSGLLGGQPSIPPVYRNPDGASGAYSTADFGLCTHTCLQDSDCPAPITGTAGATCWQLETVPDKPPIGLCVLTCEGSEECPDGFYCIDNGWSFWKNGNIVTPKACWSYDSFSGTYDPDTRMFTGD